MKGYIKEITIMSSRHVPPFMVVIGDTEDNGVRVFLPVGVLDPIWSIGRCFGVSNYHNLIGKSFILEDASTNIKEAFSKNNLNLMINPDCDEHRAVVETMSLDEFCEATKDFAYEGEYEEDDFE